MGATGKMAERRLNPNDIRPSPIRHKQLPPSLIARIEALRSTLEEYPLSIAEWLDGFQRDAHPEGEVLWWERLARCYVDYTRHHELIAAPPARLCYREQFNAILEAAWRLSA